MSDTTQSIESWSARVWAIGLVLILLLLAVFEGE